MIQLSIENINTNEIRRFLSNNPKEYEKCKKGNLALISTTIFEDPDIRSRYHEIAAYLVCSDEWDICIKEQVAKILLFALVNNSSNSKNIRITCFTQAKWLYDECDGDYKKLQKFEETTRMRFESYKPKFDNLFPNTDIEFFIPVRFFRDKNSGKNLRAFGITKFAKIRINNETYQIPRAYILKFFSKSINGKNVDICVDQKEKVGERFECNTNALAEVFTYIGFHKLLKEYVKIPDGVLTLEEGKLIGINLQNVDEEIEHLWKDLGNRKVFLPKKEYIVVNNSNLTLINFLIL